MKAILTTALSLAFVLAFTLPVDAKQAGSAGGSGNNYSCDSETGLCHCQGYFDCRNMEDKVCRSLKDGGHFACSVGKSNCNCEWKQKTLGGGRPSTTVPSRMAPPDPVVRDHRKPAVRDHRDEPAVRDHRTR